MTKDIAMKELDLNIKNQNIQVKEFTTLGYVWNKGIFVFTMIFPKNLFKKIIK